MADQSLPEQLDLLIAALNIGDLDAACEMSAVILSRHGLQSESIAAIDLVFEDFDGGAAAVVGQQLELLLSELDDPAIGTLITSRMWRALPEHSTDVTARESAALAVLEQLAIVEEPPSIALVIDDAEFDRVLSSIFSADRTEAALVHLMDAPSPLSPKICAFAERSAYRHATDPRVIRQAERVLHRFGDPITARRLEDQRKRLSPARPLRTPIERPSLEGEVIVLIGGRDGLRSAARQDLMELGAAEVRSIPPRWEKVHSTPVVAVLEGATMALAIIRQLDHSTGDHAKRVAIAKGVPVVTVSNTSPIGITKAALAERKANTRS